MVDSFASAMEQLRRQASGSVPRSLSVRREGLGRRFRDAGFAGTRDGQRRLIIPGWGAEEAMLCASTSLRSKKHGFYDGTSGSSPVRGGARFAKRNLGGYF